MSVLMVRSKVKADGVAEVEAAIEKVFSAIEEMKPDGVRYASCKLTDSATFVAFLELEKEGENPLTAMPAFQEFQATLKDLVAEPPIPETLEVVGTYRLFG